MDRIALMIEGDGMHCALTVRKHQVFRLEFVMVLPLGHDEIDLQNGLNASGSKVRVRRREGAGRDFYHSCMRAGEARPGK